MTGPEEEVLVVPRERLFAGDCFEGLRWQGLADFLERIRRHGTFRPRGEVEEDPSWKQIIPYAVVRRGKEVFLFRRTDRGGDARLHHLYALGVGGHVNRQDTGDPLEAGLQRELGEELEFTAPWQARMVAVLNDESTPVSRVHFGLVYEVRTAGDVRVRETQTLVGGFVPVERLRDYYPWMESWSQRVVEGFRW
ncbi:MAG: NUDIX domain-containing protein [Armatimonadetes bacterium]|nr:NUDIX domain-containing protein [Armatimonadota bacterium]MDW8152815.1 NUDIX domain-containing protein [Armatimonadota bacterium]